MKNKIVIMVFLLNIVKQTYARCDLIDRKSKLICEDSLELPENKNSIQELKIFNTKTQILKKIPVEFSKLRKLEISGDIQVLKSNCFENLADLQELCLSHNHIDSIPNDLFSPIKSLQKLDISHNELESPNYDTYHNLDKVVYLDLSYNKITELKLGVFDRETKVETLNLSHNRIKDLKLGILDSFTKLLVLDLSYNLVTSIPYGIFDQQKRIHTLNLSGNNFKNVVLGLFNALEHSLLTLNMSNSQIETFPLGVIDGVPNIQVLDISWNSIKVIELGILDRAHDLRVLNVSHCLLETFPSGILDKSPELHTLDLSNNGLKDFYVEMFKESNKKMSYLNLSQNQIDNLDTDIFTKTTLKVLDLSFNMFEAVQTGLLHLSSLEEIHLNNNKIMYMDPSTFEIQNSSLRYLDLSHNRLVFLRDNFFNGLIKLRHMNIGGNPWDCKCLHDLLHILVRQNIEYNKRNYFDGKKPVCVIHKFNKCQDVPEQGLSYYYNSYIEG